MSYIILLLSCIACSSVDDRQLEFALQFAGKNRHELERVLEYYKKEPQKLAAARFLIKDMPGLYSYKCSQVDSVKSVLTKEMEAGTTYGLQSIIIDDGLIKKWKNTSLENCEKVFDAHIITSDYLIENIDLSFEVWNKYSWNKALCFEDFCELILPYRLGNEPLESWRKHYYEYYSSLLDSVYKGDNLIKACDTVAKIINDEGFFLCTDFNLPNLGALYLKENRIGYCRDACDFILYVMRSIGIPTATDFYHYSPDNRLGHSWNVVRDTTGVYLQCGYTVFGTETNVRDDGRKKGKVYRFCYGSQEKYFKGSSYDNSLPELFKNRKIKDVTADYFGQNKVSIPISQHEDDHAFLGVFTIKGWIPIGVGRVENDTAVFNNLEPNVIFQTLLNINGHLHPENYPFTYTGEKMHYYIPDLRQMEDAFLTRKYPIRFYTVNSLNRNVRGAKILGSLHKNFSYYEIIYEIKDTVTTNRNIINFTEPLNYRYIRYVSPKDKPLELAEFSVYGKSDIPIPLHIIDSIIPVHTNNKFRVDHIIDNDPLTFTLSKDSTTFITFDIGKVAEIEKLLFIPRNDENFIHVGDMYELFYNNGVNGWSSLGKQIAESNILKYKVPKGALLWLRNLTKGQEEHVFYMRNDKQIFAADL
ncbi:hypothetical protein [Massilibacteroides vaginae]|uniref:hypothetical protein n=1 Tax=Massilibacteroides vaginae TaxID=1673718 RepID=UPI00111C81BD|nr:hypothetical protein [Massilibacteroides vaginae]